ncbi:ectoine/hydroxyectoine ABC transporter substrate-binding protein EhuB [Actinophytocola gossypii]|uniref:Ectoine/hydroxyectoine ABC transporter substrate-binding protein EhuB n=1 Tax=Actinophytocola gossypii TaxID=2812003 RepID=A0ABT2JAZ6_9PSEU|nr:ectoine/hydroxyectoine ABC transporter substrate-binding protein EhuB [Actinophytocola gossypii]MCT2585043.1 ectoine/hydroxyectoine ABC transporter substrate-binding protein EhuB [Actinophytocola gossypii]
MASDNWTRRDLFKRGAALGAVALGGPALLAACSEVPESGDGNTLQRVQDAGTIKVGIAGEVPYGFTEGDKVTGEAPEVAKAVFKAMGIDNVDADQVEFGQLIQGLNANQYDMVAAGMAIIPDRCENAAFSVVDYVTPTAFMVPTGNPQQVTTFEDVKAKKLKVAVLSGTIEQSVAKATGIPEGDIQPYDGQAELFQALQDGRAYCGALTDISLKQLKKDNPDAQLEVTDGFVPVIDGEEQIQAGGFVFRKGDTELLDRFNQELTKLHDSGEWLKIVEPFGFTEDNLPPDDVTTEDLCAG